MFAKVIFFGAVLCISISSWAQSSALDKLLPEGNAELDAESVNLCPLLVNGTHTPTQDGENVVAYTMTAKTTVVQAWENSRPRPSIVG